MDPEPTPCWPTCERFWITYNLPTASRSTSSERSAAYGSQGAAVRAPRARSHPPSTIAPTFAKTSARTPTLNSASRGGVTEPPSSELDVLFGPHVGSAAARPYQTFAAIRREIVGNAGASDAVSVVGQEMVSFIEFLPNAVNTITVYASKDKELRFVAVYSRHNEIFGTPTPSQ